MADRPQAMANLDELEAVPGLDAALLRVAAQAACDRIRGTASSVPSAAC
jgi:hypothetical protein